MWGVRVAQVVGAQIMPMLQANHTMQQIATLAPRRASDEGGPPVMATTTLRKCLSERRKTNELPTDYRRLDLTACP